MFPRVITLSFSFFCFFWKASNFRQTHRGAREAPLPTRSCIMNENLQILRRRWRRQFSFSFFYVIFCVFFFVGRGCRRGVNLKKNVRLQMAFLFVLDCYFLFNAPLALKFGLPLLHRLLGGVLFLRCFSPFPAFSA